MYKDIPEALRDKAKGDQDWERLMVDTFSNAEQGQIVRDQPVFFPEYTDHGPRHVSQVTEVAWRIIPPASTGERGISAGDASALSICALLHDLAMHLSEAGMKSLITPGCRWKPLADWHERPWCDLWAEFLAEARRWDDRKRREVFGERAADSEVTIRPPPFGEGAMCKDDCLLTGEFLRRHHPRLAREIAVYGFPGIDGTAIPILPSHCDHITADLLGLIARSHGLPLRSAVDRLDLRHDPRHREFRGIHPVYLMAILRIGDYLQLQSDRAPSAALLLARLLSPISQGEWAGHGTIDEVRLGGDEDPELLFVRAFPREIRAYLKVRSWLDGIQTELDQCWAVLGETYGRYPEKYRLELTVRRVKSNLDDREVFSREVDYVPEEISFTAAGGKLLKLLVGPLYGDNPSVGVRELMQNSVDAVRERAELHRQRPDLPPPAVGTEGDVIISVEIDEQGEPISVTFTDFGIGMSPDTVKNYFLTAGASFRDSTEWRKNFNTDDNEARISRTGRFGIGALAAFLIGDTIEVVTRHVESEHGISFTTSLDEEMINVYKVHDVPFGTTITIKNLKNKARIGSWCNDGEVCASLAQLGFFLRSITACNSKVRREERTSINDNPKWGGVVVD